MAMKESGIEWVGLIPDDWKIAKNNRLFNISKQLVNENWKNTQLLSLTKSGIIEKNINDGGGKQPESFGTYQYVEKDDIVLCLFDINVSAVFSDRSKYDGMISPAYRVMKCTDAILPVYAKWWFDAVNIGRYYLIYTKSLRKTIDADGFGNILTVVPPLSEQQAIADYLDETCSKIDEIIAEAKISVDEYKELRQGVIFEAVTKGVNSNVELKNSGNEWIGMMPSNKRLTKVKYCGNFKKGPFGSAITKDMFVEKGANTFKVYEQKNAIYSDCTLGYYYISKDKYEELQGFAIQPRDIIVSCAGTIGKTYVLPDNCEPGIINQALMRIRLYDKIDRTYFSYLFESLLEYAGKKYSNGSAIKNIPPFAILNNLWIVDFDVNEQIEISEYLNIKLPQIDSLISEKESLVNDLEAYKKSLIYEVVTGKRRVV